MSTHLWPASHGSQVMTDGSGLLSGHAHYLHWGVIQISLTNFLIIVFMVVVFAVALVLPFPASRRDEQDEESSDVGR
jgi:large-conductance mechanosensitive channel